MEWSKDDPKFLAFPIHFSQTNLDPSFFINHVSRPLCKGPNQRQLYPNHLISQRETHVPSLEFHSLSIRWHQAYLNQAVVQPYNYELSVHIEVLITQSIESRTQSLLSLSIEDSFSFRRL